MTPKRLIAVVTIKNGTAVQSFGYKKFLPIGKPEIVVKNLDRWGADEILINNIDRSYNKLGPNFELLKKIQKLNINTPIIYSGGIQSIDDARSVINYGADRIMVETMLDKELKTLEKISDLLGNQAIILSLPVSLSSKDELLQYDYIKKKIIKIKNNFIISIEKNLISEVLFIDHINEGYDDKFNHKILDKINIKLPIICFGGISSKKKIDKIFENKNVAAVAIGNSLNYSENRIQKLKKKLSNINIRKAFFKKEKYEF
jgi:cyclase